MIAFVIDTKGGLLLLIGLVFVLLVVIGFLPDHAISHGSTAGGGLRSGCT